jgi:3-oxoacyl-[acyl-carrier-protein] synthase II
LDRLELFVAAGGGERDHRADAEILAGLRTANNRSAYLNERLMRDLRPTLFLAQLPNLLAGNISIVHGVTGGSRTFMGEEAAGVDSLRMAAARIASGRSDAMLVGAAFNAERRDMLLFFALGGYLRSRAGFVPVFAPDRGGAITGSVGAFMVLEAADVAAGRGVRIRAELEGVAASRARRDEGGVKRGLSALIAGIGPFGPRARAVSAASGVAPWTAEEHAAISAALPAAPIIATGDHIGHAMEAAFPAAVALAAALLDAGEAEEALVTGAGHWRGEGAARLVSAHRAP